MDKLWIFLHLVGVVFGTGAVTVAYAHEVYFKFHPHQAHKRGTLAVIKSLITLGIAITVITGMALYLKHPQVLASTAFKQKMVVLLLLVINHILINIHFRPKYGNLHAFMKISHFISFFGWYALIYLSLGF